MVNKGEVVHWNKLQGQSMVWWVKEIQDGFQKWRLKCPVFRSEYQKFSARATRSRYLICEIPILFVNSYKKFLK